MKRDREPIQLLQAQTGMRNHRAFLQALRDGEFKATCKTRRAEERS